MSLAATPSATINTADAIAKYHISHLQVWLENLKKDPRLTPQQFSALEKAIMLAIITFQQPLIKKNEEFYNSATNVEEPMEID